jgi:hypothetical protein
MAARLARRRLLVLGVLAGGPADTATVARPVRGAFYEVLGVLADLRCDGEVVRVGHAWQRADRSEDVVHEPPIGTPAARL